MSIFFFFCTEAIVNNEIFMIPGEFRTQASENSRKAQKSVVPALYSDKPGDHPAQMEIIGAAVVFLAWVG